MSGISGGLWGGKPSSVRLDIFRIEILAARAEIDDPSIMPINIITTNARGEGLPLMDADARCGFRVRRHRSARIVSL